MAHKVTPPLSELGLRLWSTGYQRGLTAQFQERPTPEDKMRDIEAVLKEHPEAVRALDCYQDVLALFKRAVKLYRYRDNLLSDKSGTTWRKHSATFHELSQGVEECMVALLKRLGGKA